MFKRYDGFVGAAMQRYIDTKIPVCPFCGGIPKWSIDRELKIDSNIQLFKCNVCDAIVATEVKSAAIEFADNNNDDRMFVIREVGTINSGGIKDNVSYTLSALTDIASELHAPIISEDKSIVTSNTNKAAEFGSEKSGNIENLIKKRYKSIDFSSEKIDNNKTNIPSAIHIDQIANKKIENGACKEDHIPGFERIEVNPPLPQKYKDNVKESDVEQKTENFSNKKSTNTTDKTGQIVLKVVIGIIVFLYFTISQCGR